MLARLVLVCLIAGIIPPVGAQTIVDPARVDAVASMLGDSVFAFGPKIDDRASWDALGAQPVLHGAIAKAEKLAAQAIAPLPDALFLEFSRTGNRTDYEKVYFNRTGRLTPLVIAECIEHRGRFIPAIDALVAAFDQQKTWMLPAHDPELRNFHGEGRDIDLFSSALACDLANAKYLLGDALDDNARETIDRNVRRRVLDPFREMVTGNRPANWWLTSDNNWNAVCLANVLGAALATVGDKHDRAVFAAAAEQGSLHYLSGFAGDGYCVEGLGYWNYGFGNYIRLCELLYRASNGKIDCFHRDKVRAIARYPGKLAIVDDVYPAYGDVHLDAKPTPALVDFVDRKFALPGRNVFAPAEISTSLGGSLGETLMFSCPNSASDLPLLPAVALPVRDWFEDAQVLVCRPAVDSNNDLAVSIKGGHNGENHGHDDLGSFVLVVGKTPLLLDPGAEVYTARTFSKHRFDSKLLNSFGHNVPVVAGQLQISTAAARVNILNRQFTDSADVLEMDLTSAYAVPELKSLHRTFTFTRGSAASLTIDDRCVFATPQSFGIAFVTFGNWKQTSPTSLKVWQGDAAVQVDFETADGRSLKMSSQTIEEDSSSGKHPTRISVDVAGEGVGVGLKAKIAIGS